MKTVYLLLCVLGTVLPYSQFGPWLLVHGLDTPLFFAELFSTRIGGFFGLDVLVSALVVWVFVFTEGSRLGMRRLWAPVIATLLVGVSLVPHTPPAPAGSGAEKPGAVAAASGWRPVGPRGTPPRAARLV